MYLFILAMLKNKHQKGKAQTYEITEGHVSILFSGQYSALRKERIIFNEYGANGQCVH